MGEAQPPAPGVRTMSAGTLGPPSLTRPAIFGAAGDACLVERAPGETSTRRHMSTQD